MFTMDLFAGIDEEIIRKTMKGIHANLERVAVKYCCNKHVAKHFACSDEYLQNRIYAENKKMATSFYDDNAKTLVAIFTEVMNHNWHLIKAFLRKEENSLTIFWDFNKSLGFGYKAGIQGVFEDLHMVQMGITKRENSDYGFVITTAYLVITDDAAHDESVEWLREEA